MRSILRLKLEFDQDAALARQRVRELAGVLGLDVPQQTRLATAVSELARNALRQAGTGTVEFLLDEDPPTLKIRIEDQGSPIEDVNALLEGRGSSDTMGVVAARRLVEDFAIESAPGGGTRITLGKSLPRSIRPQDWSRIDVWLTRRTAADPFEEVRQQNQELVAALGELRARQEELAELNRELEDTNRGVVALYAELDEKAYSLQRANEVKSRFLSNMSHEFRTPLTSILSLSRLLVDRIDGELNPEQERQVLFIRRAAESLLELVNDLLDLAKVEAGKIRVRPARFEAADLFGALRGMLRPLLAANSALSLVFEEPGGIPTMNTDEGKVSQILRNFISNALKFTERGEVRVSAAREADRFVRFSVADTGIGIAPEDQQTIFQEFGQIEHPIQRRVRGTGLGLPLSRKLAELLGGKILLESQVGRGSTFSLVIPTVYSGADEVISVPEVNSELDPLRTPLLVIEDNRETLFTYEKLLKGSGYQVIPATTLDEARRMLGRVRPAAIVLDILLANESTWALLGELRAAEATRALPVLVVTMVDNEQKALASGANAYCQKPVTREWLLAKLGELAPIRVAPRILVIDDDEASRYILKGHLAPTTPHVLEASDGPTGLRIARETKPAAIFLDLGMPGMSGFAVLEELERDETLREIPVIIYTSRVLTDEERSVLEARAVAILSKEPPSRVEAAEQVRDALLAAGIGQARAARAAAT